MTSLVIPSGLTCVLFHITRVLVVGCTSWPSIKALGRILIDAPQSIWKLTGFLFINIWAWISLGKAESSTAHTFSLSTRTLPMKSRSLSESLSESLSCCETQWTLFFLQHFAKWFRAPQFLHFFPHAGHFSFWNGWSPSQNLHVFRCFDDVFVSFLKFLCFRVLSSPFPRTLSTHSYNYFYNVTIII